MKRQSCLRIAFLLSVLMAPAMLIAQQSKPGDDVAVAPEGTQVATEQTPAASANTNALQKATQNPVASLISVPIQNNSNFGISPGDRTQDVLNIQPVIPVSASKNWNLVIRWIMPIIYQPLPNQTSPTQTGVYGFGDMQPTFFLVPKKNSKLIWGAGPIVQIPTATSNYLGQGKLGLGPSVVLLTQPGPWTIGVLANNVWSIAGSGGRPAVNQFLMQYFINYNLKKGWYLSTSPIVTANWESSERKSMDRALRRRSGQDYEAGISAGEPERLVLRQRGLSHGNFIVEHAAADCPAVSQADQATADDADAAEIEAAASGAGATIKVRDTGRNKRTLSGGQDENGFLPDDKTIHRAVGTHTGCVDRFDAGSVPSKRGSDGGRDERPGAIRA